MSGAPPRGRGAHGREVETDHVRKGDAIVCAACPVLMKDARPDSRWTLSQFKIGRELGSGFASVVYQAQCRLTGLPCVVKVYKKNVHEVLEMQIAREIAIHSRIKHPYAIDLFAAFDDPQNHYLILEFMPKGDLFAYLEDRKYLDEMDTVRMVALPMLLVLKHLHQKGVIHRDIKPENIMLDGHGTVKLADFGLSIQFTEERPVSRVGTLDYMPPEVVACADKVHAWENKNNFAMEYGAAADVWALGVLVYEMLFGWPPFNAKDVNDLRAKQSGVALKMPAGFRVSNHGWDFLKLCMTLDPKGRPTCAELMTHPWIVQHIPESQPKINARESELMSATSAINMALNRTPAGASASSHLRASAGSHLRVSARALSGTNVRASAHSRASTADDKRAGATSGGKHKEGVLSRLFHRAGSVAPTPKQPVEGSGSGKKTFAQRVKSTMSFRSRNASRNKSKAESDTAKGMNGKVNGGSADSITAQMGRMKM